MCVCVCVYSVAGSLKREGVEKDFNQATSHYEKNWYRFELLHSQLYSHLYSHQLLLSCLGQKNRDVKDDEKAEASIMPRLRDSDKTASPRFCDKLANKPRQQILL